MSTSPQRTELTDFQKGEIIALRKLMSHREIGRRLDIPHHTISSFLTRFDLRQSIENLLRPGAPQKLSESDKRYIVHTAELNTRVPLAELQKQTNCNVSEQTLRRRLREAGI